AAKANAPGARPCRRWRGSMGPVTHSYHTDAKCRDHAAVPALRMPRAHTSSAYGTVSSMAPGPPSSRSRRLRSTFSRVGACPLAHRQVLRLPRLFGAGTRDELLAGPRRVALLVVHLPRLPRSSVGSVTPYGWP